MRKIDEGPFFLRMPSPPLPICKNTRSKADFFPPRHATRDEHCPHHLKHLTPHANSTPPHHSVHEWPDAASPAVPKKTPCPPATLEGQGPAPRTNHSSSNIPAPTTPLCTPPVKTLAQQVKENLGPYFDCFSADFVSFEALACEEGACLGVTPL